MQPMKRNGAEQYDVRCNIGDDRRPYSLETWEKAFEIWNKQQPIDFPGRDKPEFE